MSSKNDSINATVNALFTKLAKVKAVEVALDKITIDIANNFRDEKGKDYDSIPGLQQSIREVGQTDALILREMEDGSLVTLQGNRRSIAVKGEPSLGIVGLVDIYPDGVQDAETGKIRKFDTMSAKIIKCTDTEAGLIRDDHGNVEPQSRVGFCKFVYWAFSQDPAWTEKQIVTSHRGIIEQLNPMTPKEIVTYNTKIAGFKASIKESAPNYARLLQAAEENAYLETRRGFIQGIHQAYDSPTMVWDEFIRRERGEQKWPTTGEIKMLLKIFTEEQKTDMLNITKENPGPAFMAEWDKIVNVKAEEAESGTSKPRALSAMTGTEIAAAMAKVNHPLIRAVFMSILRKVEKPGDVLAICDSYAASTDKVISEEQTKLRALLVAAVQAATPATATDGK